MSAIDVIRRRLGEAGIPEATVPKEEKPDVVAFVDVKACTACGLCAPHCPAGCIETLEAGAVEGRDPQPVQVRYQECVGCRVCVEICAHVAQAHAIQAYDTNLAEQGMSTEISDRPEPAGEAPEAWDEIWAEEGSFHHMGEGSAIEDRLTAEDREIFAGERASR